MSHKVNVMPMKHWAQPVVTCHFLSVELKIIGIVKITDENKILMQGYALLFHVMFSVRIVHFTMIIYNSVYISVVKIVILCPQLSLNPVN